MIIFEIMARIWAVALIIGATIPFFREQTWWLRAWTYARLQMFVLMGVTAIFIGFYLGLKSGFDQALFGGLIISALTCLRDIFPFTRFASKQTRDLAAGETHIPIRLMVGNVLMENDQTEAYLAQIRENDPDILFLVETNEFWKDALSVLEMEYPHSYLLPLEDFNGMLFYSRFPITASQERYLVQSHIPSLTFDLDVGAPQPLRFYGVHPRPPRPQDDTADLDKELMFVGNELGRHSGPAIITGDLNDVGWSTTTKKFLRQSGLLDPRHGRGLYNSYNAKNPLIRWPLDHVFHSAHFSLIDMQRLAPCGSDHFPLLIEFGLIKA